MPNVKHRLTADDKREIRREVRGWSRHEVQLYLESYGYAVYDYEDLDELQEAAFQNAVTEGGL